MKVKLAHSFSQIELREEAVKLLGEVLEYYPISQSSSSAITLLNKIECENLFNIYSYSSIISKKYLSKKWAKHVGIREDVKNLLLAQNGLNIENIKNQLKNTKPAFEEKIKLLKSAESLFAFREYRVALEILHYLDSLKIKDVQFPKDTLLEYLGRVYNALNNPNKAAESYKRFFQSFPDSPKVKSILERIGKSLHFDRRFFDAAMFLENKKIVTRDNRDNWFIFWNYYLSRNYKKAKLIAEKMLGNLKESHPDYRRYRYWLAKIYRKIGQVNKGNQIWNEQIKQCSTNDIYTFFIQQQLSDSKEKSQNYALPKDITVRDSLVTFNAKPNEKNKFIFELLEYGLLDFASLYIRAYPSVNLVQSEALEIGEIAYKNQDFYDAILISNNFVNVKKYQKDSPIYKQFMRLNYPLAFWDEVQFVAQNLEVNPFWILAIIRTESLFHKDARSHVGAVGLMQLMPYTGYKIAEYLKIKDFHPETSLRDHGLSIFMGGWYLHHLVKSQEILGSMLMTEHNIFFY
ncbi:MAG: transglycosylase SLT domain-containing protein, partial [Silvanigrellaceae bacterium]|nr:transglycosylase SLT domain-containing protein [Silvanigrellaceae bacterium]